MKSKAPKRDKHLFLAIALVVIVAAIAVFPFVVSMRAVRRFQEFKDAYKDSMLYGRNHNSIEAEYEGERYAMPADDASGIFSVILTCGMGKEQKVTPEGDSAAIYFGDGAKIEFWEVPIPEKSRENDFGTFVRYEKGDFVYQYDTDKLEISRVLGWF